MVDAATIGVPEVESEAVMDEVLLFVAVFDDVPLFVAVFDEVPLFVAVTLGVVVAVHVGAIESPVVVQPAEHGHVIAAPEPVGQYEPIGQIICVALVAGTGQ